LPGFFFYHIRMQKDSMQRMADFMRHLDCSLAEQSTAFDRENGGQRHRAARPLLALDRLGRKG
jgi:hypothetical protein